MGKGAGKGGRDATSGLNKIAGFFSAFHSSTSPIDAIKLNSAIPTSYLIKKVAKPVTLDELQAHSSPASAWIAIKGKVYDVTTFAAQHPGGPVIYTYAGKDATDVFSAMHDSSSFLLLKDYYIGNLDASAEDASTTPLLRDFRALRTQLASEGLFRASPFFYVYKMVSTNLLLAASLYLLLAHGASSLVACAASATLLGLYWQQSGWHAHDYLHNQVFANRNYNHLAGIFIGNLCQGFSVQWWKSKHNTHHAAPNEVKGASFVAIDPDIDTLPLLAWDVSMLAQVTDPSYRQAIKYQHYLLGPLLLFARIMWAQQSIETIVKHRASALRSQKGGMKMHHWWLEAMATLLHYTWSIGLGMYALGFIQGLVYVFAAQCACGAMLSFIFVLSHNGMQVYSHHEQYDFFTAQIVSTRNQDAGLLRWKDWFSGGLNMQIEHHLFPTMPRHHLHRAKDRVRALCEKHGLKYEEMGFWGAMGRVMDRLREVAREA